MAANEISRVPGAIGTAYSSLMMHDRLAPGVGVGVGVLVIVGVIVGVRVSVGTEVGRGVNVGCEVRVGGTSVFEGLGVSVGV